MEERNFRPTSFAHILKRARRHPCSSSIAQCAISSGKSAEGCYDPFMTGAWTIASLISIRPTPRREVYNLSSQCSLVSYTSPRTPKTKRQDIQSCQQEAASAAQSKSPTPANRPTQQSATATTTAKCPAGKPTKSRNKTSPSSPVNLKSTPKSRISGVYASP